MKKTKVDYVTDNYLLSITRNGERIKKESLLYLGSVRRSEMESIKYRIYYWQHIDQILDRLLASDELKNAVRRGLEKKVRRPSDSDIEEYRKELLSKSQFDSLLQNKDHASIDEDKGKQHKKSRKGRCLH